MSLLDEESLVNDRYSVYERSRPYGRRIDRDELWFFEPVDCSSVLSSTDLSSQRSGLANRLEQAGFPLLGQFFRQWLMYSDGTDHLHRRAAVVRALRQIGLDATVERPTFSIRTEFDLVKDFCEPFVWHVLPRLLGLTTEERDFWKPRIASLVALPGSESPNIELLRSTELGLQELHQFLLLHPCKLLSILSRDLGQSTETTNLAINVIGDGVHPTIASLASEVFLRLSSDFQVDSSSPHLVFHHDPPFQFAARVAIHPTSIGEVRIEIGQRVVACLGAANRASAAGQPPMTFGHGRHACIGRAHAEKCIRSGSEMFWELTEGRARLVSRPRWTKSIGYRMIEALQIQIPPK
jgi:cytochrome P450